MADEPEPTERAEKPASKDEPVTRPKNLYYVGERDPNTDAPVQFVMGVPAMDLTEEDIRFLSDKQVKVAMESGIYQKTAPAKAKKGGD